MTNQKIAMRSEEHTSELQSRSDLVCRLLLEKKKHTSELQSRSDLVCRLLLEKKKNKKHDQYISNTSSQESREDRNKNTDRDYCQCLYVMQSASRALISPCLL